METTRKCNRCDAVKDITEFEPAKRYRGGRMPVCRSCRAVYRALLADRPKHVGAEGKRCCKCNDWRPIGDFRKCKRSRDGLDSRCRPCCKNTKSPEVRAVVRARFLMWRYGVSVEWYADTLAAQGGGCAVCKVEPPDGGVLEIDHNHATGAVRGILCSVCNRSLGMLQESAQRIDNLAAYIRRFP